MKIEGHFLRDIIEFLDCEILIEHGKIHDVSVPDFAPINSSSKILKNKSEYELEKLSSNTRIQPYESNYIIEYVSKNNNPQKIYLKLNPWKLIRIKWAMRKYIIQSKEMKTDILKYIIGAVIGFLFTIILQWFQFNSNKEITSPQKQKIKENSELKSENVNDMKVMLKNMSEQNELSKLTELKNGRWIHENDSLAGIEIKNKKIILFYKGNTIHSSDIYDYKMIKGHSTFADSQPNTGEFLILTNLNDTLKYELVEYNENILSLIYLPRGNFHNYRKE